MPLFKTIFFSLFLSYSAYALGQSSYERNELGSPDKQVDLHTALAISDSVTVLYGATTLTDSFMQASAIAIDHNGNELWRYGYGEPNYYGYTEFTNAVKSGDGIRLFAKSPRNYLDEPNTKYIDLDVYGTPIDTTSFKLNNENSFTPGLIYQLDSIRTIYVNSKRSSSGSQQIILADQSGTILKEIVYQDQSTFRTFAHLITLENGLGIIQGQNIYAIDFDNEQVDKIFELDTLFNGLPAGNIIPVFNSDKTICQGVILEDRNTSNNQSLIYRELDMQGDVLFEQSLQTSTTHFSNEAILLDSILYAAQWGSQEIQYESFDLSRNGVKLINNQEENPVHITMIPGISLTPINGQVHVLQQSLKKLDKYTFENTLLNFSTLDTFSNIQDYRDSTFFNPEEYYQAGSHLFLRNASRNPETPWPAVVAHDNQSFERDLSFFIEGYPSFHQALQVEPESQNVICLSDVYENSNPNSHRPIYLRTEAHAFDTLGNTLWNHETTDLLSGSSFFPVAEGYVYRTRYRGGSDTMIVRKVAGATGDNDWELKILTPDSTWLSLQDAKEISDTTYLLLNGYILDSIQNAYTYGTSMLAVDASGSIIWNKVFYKTFSSKITSVVKDSIDLISGEVSFFSGSTPVTVSWHRIAMSSGNDKRIFVSNEPTYLGSGYTILDYQRVAFFHSDYFGSPRAIKLLDVADTSLIDLISYQEAVANLDRFYSMSKRENELSVKGNTRRHGLGLNTLFSIPFAPRTPPAFQGPTPGPEQRISDQDIELLENPVKDQILFLTKYPVALDKIQLYTMAGQLVTDTEISQTADGVYQIRFASSPIGGIYILTTGEASKQVLVR